MKISARAIAKRAGVSVGTLYTYYENLPDLMQSLWQEPVDRLVVRLDAVAEATPDPIDRIRALLEGYAEFARRQHAVYRGAFLFVRSDSMKKPEKRPLDEAPFHRLLKSAIMEGQSTGRVRAGDPDAVAQMLWAGLHGSLALPVNIDRFAFDPPERLAQTMIDALMNLLTPSV